MKSSNSALFTEIARSYDLHSCSYCQTIVVDLTELALPNTKVGTSDTSNYQQAEDTSLVEDLNSEDTKEALLCQYKFPDDVVAQAAAHCPLFKLFLPWSEELDWHDVPLDVRIKPNPLNCVARRIMSEEFDIRLGQVTRSLISGPEAFGALIHPWIDSDEVFSRARQLLKKCLSEHDDCKQNGTPPSRLIDVRPVLNDSLRIVNTRSDQDAVWAALSYCWGGLQEAQTTYLNVKDRYQHLSLTDLPLTIRDAVRVCREMHIPYLWVDSLCIIQVEDEHAGLGRETDKERELRKMAGIFRGAVLTISASCSSSSKEGFLQSRKPYDPAIGLPVRVNGHYDIAQLVWEPDTIDREVKPEPVDSRAWIFQEQLLSARILSFPTHAMQWHCRCEDWSISQEEEYNVCKTFPVLENFSRGRWNSLVTDYTRRNLSNIEDRSIAIAAVAESFADSSSKLSSSDYLSGLWKPTLLTDLLWNTQQPKHATGSKLVAPSWSWTSVAELVEWFWADSSERDDFVPTARVLSSEMELADPQLPFGAAKSGMISLHGLITHNERYLACTRPSEDDATDMDAHLMYLFADDLEATHMEVFLFEIGHQRESGFTCRQGLALKPTGRPEEFSRVGMYLEVKPDDKKEEDISSCKYCKDNKSKEKRSIKVI
ncbi:hypothetical protein NW762_004585 [Fusarium torreyae]|uniref:Heterokaryon incompatibility domain-containing protein n=1 Tax=Fusarium torreyae TaxID=1237075 RepID=A0A9W8S4Y6_9HYPO|nr:hypothetical protein NW762_004585 [Fusarium torreyae]